MDLKRDRGDLNRLDERDLYELRLVWVDLGEVVLRLDSGERGGFLW